MLSKIGKALQFLAEVLAVLIPFGRARAWWKKTAGIPPSPRMKDPRIRGLIFSVILLGATAVQAATLPAPSAGGQATEPVEIIIIDPPELTWDHPVPALVEEYRMYCRQSPGVTIDPANLQATIPGTDPGRTTEVAEWSINIVVPGDWYCAVSAARPSEQLESGLSNEIWLRIKSFDPTGLRKKE